MSITQPSNTILIKADRQFVFLWQGPFWAYPGSPSLDTSQKTSKFRNAWYFSGNPGKIIYPGKNLPEIPVPGANPLYPIEWPSVLVPKMHLKIFIKSFKHFDDGSIHAALTNGKLFVFWIFTIFDWNGYEICSPSLMHTDRKKNISNQGSTIVREEKTAKPFL